MRDLLNKTTAVAMVVAAALAVSACGKSETTNTVDNTSMTDTNAMMPAEGSMNDMAASSLGNDTNMSDSNMSDNGVMGSNSSNMM